MKKIILVTLLILTQHFVFAQQFVLEAEISGEIEQVFDIENDGVYEYIIRDSLVIFDGASHQLKYNLPEYLYVFYEEISNKFLKNVDYNSDGNNDLIIGTNTWPDAKVVVYDIVNNQILFEFDPTESSAFFKYLIDIDGDGILEIIFGGKDDFNGDISKTYIYSTGVSVTSVSEDKIERPNTFKLSQNFPNPFNPSTTIRYSISTPGNISIKVYDLSGQLVKTIDNEHSIPGEYEIIWDGSNNFGERVASGVYFYQLKTGSLLETKKMMLLK